MDSNYHNDYKNISIYENYKLNKPLDTHTHVCSSCISHIE